MRRVCKKIFCTGLIGISFMWANVTDAAVPAKFPLICYSAQRVYTYNDIGGPKKGWIDANVDQIKINQINGEWAYGSYPTSKGTVSRWFRLGDIVPNLNYSNYDAHTTSRTTAYKTESGNATLGTVFPTDNITVVYRGGSRSQIVYPISGGYKMGWIANSSIASSVPTPTPVSRAASIEYQPCVQGNGWIKAVRNGAIGGTVGQAKRLEGYAMTIPGENANSSALMYHSFYNGGWENWKGCGNISGGTGMTIPIEAIEIKLGGNYAMNYDVYYRVHVSNIGWLGWARNGESAGSKGYGYGIEAIQAVIVKKGEYHEYGGSSAISIKPDNQKSSSGYCYPLGKKVTFGNADEWNDNKPHDYGVALGTPVYAPFAGEVKAYQCMANIREKGYITVSYGNVIYLTNGNKEIRFGHLDHFEGINTQYSNTQYRQDGVSNTKELCGSRYVNAGDLIGYVGTVGNSTGPHLHIEFRINGRRVNPNNYF